MDAGAGNDVERYVWDDNDSKYVLQLGESTALTDAQIKAQYEANADTNAFTDAEKTKLAGVEAGAEVNEVGEAPNDGNLYGRKNENWEQLPAQNIYGTQRTVSIDTSYVTTTTKFPDVATVRQTLTTSNLPLGTYRLTINFQWLEDKDCRFRAQIYHVEAAAYLNEYMNYKSDETSDQLTATMVIDDLLISGVNNFQLHYGSDAHGADTTIGDLHMELIRVA